MIITSHETENGNFKLKQQFQKNIDKQIAEFFASGKKITHIPTGVSGVKNGVYKSYQGKNFYTAFQIANIKRQYMKRVKELKNEYGSLRAASQHTDISYSMLSKLYRGVVNNPGKELLFKLGLE